MSLDGGSDWRDLAACATADPELFFDVADESRLERAKRESRALRFCARCVVQPECLATAMLLDAREGVWGGRTEANRAQARRRAG